VNRILLDTSAYAAFKRGHPQIEHRIREAEQIHLSPIVLGELRAGFLKGVRQIDNLADLTRFLASPRVEVAALGEETAARYSIILDGLRRAGTPIPTNDVWIAASAMELGATLVTTDSHFQGIPQIVAEILEPRLPRA
jgi:tRNA(fMet)-specific endonuclease VapC